MLKSILLNLSFYFSFLTFINTAFAQPAELDYTFSSDGYTTTTDSDDEFGRSVVIQPDGKIVVLGDYYNGTNNDFKIIRYNPDGTFDMSFDSDGIVTIDINSDDIAQTIVLQVDGKIIVAGHGGTITNHDFILARLNPNGSLDNTFDGDGKIITGSSSNENLSDVELQADGKIVTIGEKSSGSNTNIYVVRYNSDGSLDMTFSGDGKQTTDIFDADGATAVAIQSDGKIIVAGYTSEIGYYDFVLVRYNTNGSLDTDFAGDGIVIHDHDWGDLFSDVTVTVDGKIIGAGQISADSDMAVLKFNSDGTIDNSFGVMGIALIDAGTDYEQSPSVIIQNDGKIVLAGTTSDGSQDDFMIARLNADGSDDNSFDTDGILISDFGESERVAAVALQNDGKIVVVGTMDDGFNNDIIAARYHLGWVGLLEKTNSSLIAFPNPVNQKLTVTCKNEIVGGSIQITDITGKIIYSESNLSGNSFILDLSNEPTGIYFLRLNDGVINRYLKIVKE